MTARVTVHKLNWRGEHVYSWQGDLWREDERGLLVRAVWRGPGTVRVAGSIAFEPGDVFYEYYDEGRPYGLWQVLTPDEGHLKCWYCNISTPIERDGTDISFRDLLLDVLLWPDGHREVLDRDDLARAVADGLDPGLAALAEEGAQAVLGLIERRVPPFDAPAQPPARTVPPDTLHN